ncbi:conserved Plasmodium protein, unknown function [Plasmodium knowlesi strain H]|uniref:DEK-C domain-containing protein n=3 Tax=Plasmodium knowlesi TaxID=5850 RepID=A0A5E7X5A5_PLAKH|nr:conserved protein, unknown function [Plasmodium knowlesi strain H]OTN67639.1 Uncharacterized protein PKNOH_S05384100 [Plasmodium knowlesi]CAA9990428.1 conserved protein, unknown function [Plasmodium knowlesi strain H]SBO19634.1 conserved Plasmodium protein, unknown function [Plasmodium knowlesi strain H]SBO22565.1 conserved Plasmodium protein, unknown function [Plasmodium knowlesi strain H]VVS79902.1 conserved protein, unknown function [Plasmodium knowlesi strain H]
MGVEDISAEELEKATRSFVSIESATQISRRYVRKKLEEIFNLEENSLYERKKEINDIVAKVLTNLLEEENRKKNEELRSKDANANSVETNDKADQNGENCNSRKRRNSQNKTKGEIVKKENMNDDKSSSAESDSNDKSSSKKRKKNDEPLSARKKQANVMTKDYFLDNSESLLCNISDNIKLKLEPRIFSTGSCGWHMMDKVYLLVGDHNVLCQLCINCSVIGSKQWN